MMKFKATMDQLPVIMGYLQDFLESISLTKEDHYHIELAFEEAVVNIIHYAYGENSGDIEVDLLFEPPFLTISLKDWGVYFDPTTHAEPIKHQTIEEMSIGGLGISLFFKVMDNVFYERKEGMNHLMLKKIVSHPGLE